MLGGRGVPELTGKAWSAGVDWACSVGDQGDQPDSVSGVARAMQACEARGDRKGGGSARTRGWRSRGPPGEADWRGEGEMGGCPWRIRKGGMRQLFRSTKMSGWGGREEVERERM